MNKFRKVCRGSGRALALIFAASVVWLIFDMAALKLSFGESGAKVLQGETGGKEKGPGRVWRNSEDGAGRWSREEPEASPPFAGQGGKKLSRNGEDAGRDAEGRGGQRLSPGATPAKAAPGLRDIFPLKWQRSPAQPFSRAPEKKVNGAAATGGDPRQTKLALARREQEPHSVVAGGRAPVNPTLRNGVPQRTAGGAEAFVHTEFTETGALAGLKRGAPPGNMPEARQGSPGLLEANGPEGLGRTVEVPGVRWDLPAGKLNTSTSEKKEVSLNKIAPGDLPSRKKAKLPPAKDALSENQQVFGTKELVPMFFPTTRHLQPSTKGLKGMGKYGQLPGEKSSNRGETIHATRRDGLIKTMILARGGALGKVDKGHLAGEEQFAKPNQSHVDVAAGNSRLHKVFTIDRTLTPRDPRAPGQFGRPAKVPGEKEEEAKRRWNEGNFNVYLSDLIPVDRAIDDTRPAG
uniref:Uncharacterized protein n=1 Tax=Laticauda laticaudata TaxID=8630 RepID=A0A8C5S323_LATLA